MILTTKALKARFEANLARSNRVEIATAWATNGPALELLCKAVEVEGVKVRAVVGTYGNATHPDALDRLNSIGTLRLAESDGAMFHPKVYIFHGSDASRAWIGSANFTGGGFDRNEEVVHETDDVAGAAVWFARRWRACGRLPRGAIDKYRKRRLSQGVSRGLAVLAAGRTDVGTKRRLALLRGANGWKEYVAALEACNESWLDEGYGWSVLGTTHSYVHTITEAGAVAQSRPWTGMPPQRAGMLLGLRDEPDGTWGLLGSLGAAGTAKKVLLQSHEAKYRPVLERLRRSVDRVIQAGDDEIVDATVEVLEDLCRTDGKGVAGFGPGVVTRLLALARPDRLVSVNDGSRHGLSAVFGLARTTLGEPRNYRRLLEAVYELPWYGDRPGRSRREWRLWSMRAALIDSFVYDPSR